MESFKNNSIEIDFDLLSGLDLDAYARKIECTNESIKYSIQELLSLLNQDFINNVENLLENINHVLKMAPKNSNYDNLFSYYHTFSRIQFLIESSSTNLCCIALQTMLWICRCSNLVFQFLKSHLNFSTLKYLRSPFLNIPMIALLLRIINYDSTYARYLACESPLFSIILSLLPDIENCGRAGAFLTLLNTVFENLSSDDLKVSLSFPFFLPDDDFEFEKQSPIIVTFIDRITSYILGSNNLCKNTLYTSYQIQSVCSHSLALLSQIIMHSNVNDPNFLKLIFTEQIAAKIFSILVSNCYPPIIYLEALRVFNAVLCQCGFLFIKDETMNHVIMNVINEIIRRFQVPNFPKLRCIFVLSNAACFDDIGLMILQKHEDFLMFISKNFVDFQIEVKENIFIFILNLMSKFPNSISYFLDIDLLMSIFDLLNSYFESCYPTIVINTFKNLLNGPKCNEILSCLDISDVIISVESLLEKPDLELGQNIISFLSFFHSQSLE